MVLVPVVVVEKRVSYKNDNGTLRFNKNSALLRDTTPIYRPNDQFEKCRVVAPTGVAHGLVSTLVIAGTARHQFEYVVWLPLRTGVLKVMYVFRLTKKLYFCNDDQNNRIR